MLASEASVSGALSLYSCAAASALSRVASEPKGGLIVLPDVTTGANGGLIVALAAHYHLPAVYGFRYMVAEVGLVGDLYRRAANYVGRALRGEQISDLPVQAPIKFEFVLNLKTAKTLGLTIPRR